MRQSDRGNTSLFCVPIGYFVKKSNKLVKTLQKNNFVGAETSAHRYYISIRWWFPRSYFWLKELSGCVKLSRRNSSQHTTYRDVMNIIKIVSIVKSVNILKITIPIRHGLL